MGSGLSAALEKILQDRVSGASEIESELLEALAKVPEADVAAVVRALPKRLRETFPQMANLEGLARGVEALSGALAAPDVRAASLAALVERLASERAARRKGLSAAIVPLLPDGDLLVFTLSKSGSVASVLLDLHAEGRRLAVLVAESRPGGEGASMARELGARGIRTRAVDDLLLLSLVPAEAAARRPNGYAGAGVVLVGADAVHPDAFVNKVGTRALLETAQRAGVAAFVLAASSKLRADEAPRALGSLFETVPRNGFAVVTEAGLLETEDRGLTR